MSFTAVSYFAKYCTSKWYVSKHVCYHNSSTCADTSKGAHHQYAPYSSCSRFSKAAMRAPIVLIRTATTCLGQSASPTQKTQASVRFTHTISTCFTRTVRDFSSTWGIVSVSHATTSKHVTCFSFFGTDGCRTYTKASGKASAMT